MKVLELLEELEDIVETASKVPLTGKALLDIEEVMEIVREIRNEMPGELQKAKQIADDRVRILDEAEMERNAMLSDARAQAEALVDRDEITNNARIKADKIISNADLQSKNLKMRTYEYLDTVMNSMLESVEYANSVTMEEMYDTMKKSFDKLTATLNENKAELNKLSYEESVRKGTRETLDENFNPIDESADE